MCSLRCFSKLQPVVDTKVRVTFVQSESTHVPRIDDV
jgi:hypothetical protein